MTRTLLAAAAILSGLATASWALDNNSAIEILGSGNDTRVDQRGTANNKSTVKQDGSGNTANIDQSSSNFTDENENSSFVEQIGANHKVQVTQGGAGNNNTSEILLKGDSNEVQIRQYEQFNQSFSRVETTGGSQNTIAVTQGGTGNTNTSSVLIGGSNNNAAVFQH
jgi:hypothetical protein